MRNIFIDKEYVSELKQFLKYEAKSRVARYAIYPVGFGLATLLAFGTAQTPVSAWGVFCSFMGFCVLELLFALGVTWCIFTFVHPYDKIAQRNRQREISRIMSRFKEECDRETKVRIIQENEMLRAQLMKDYQKKHDEEMNLVRQQATDEQERLENVILTKSQELEQKERDLALSIKDSQQTIAELKQQHDAEISAQKEEIAQMQKDYEQKHQVEMTMMLQQATEEQERLENVILTKSQELEQKERDFMNSLQSNQRLLDNLQNNYDVEIEAKKAEIAQLRKQVEDIQKETHQKLAEAEAAHSHEMELFKRKTIDELYTEDYKAFEKVAAMCARTREEQLKKLNHRMVTVGQYVAYELSKFGFDTGDITAIQLLFKIYVETSGGYDSKQKSPLANKYNVEGRGRGRKKKVCSNDIVLSTQDLGHLTWNIANYLDYKVEDVAMFVKVLFADWCKDSSAGSIAKSAKKESQSDNITLVKDLEIFLKENNGKDTSE